MQTFVYTISDESGIHARPAGLLAQTAKKFTSEIQIEKDGHSVDAKNLMLIMSLCAKCGETISISADGDDELDAIKAIEEFLKENL